MVRAGVQVEVDIFPVTGMRHTSCSRVASAASEHVVVVNVAVQTSWSSPKSTRIYCSRHFQILCFRLFWLSEQFFVIISKTRVQFLNYQYWKTILLLLYRSDNGSDDDITVLID